MKKTRKFLAVLLVGLMISGGMAVSATATPDEWILYDEAVSSNIDTDEENTRYTVQKGDNLLTIAQRFGVSTVELVSMNKLSNADLIKEGQDLIVTGSNCLHSVIAGETLSGIAKTYGVRAGDIVVANDLKNEDLLVIGEKLLIPRKPGYSIGLPAWNVTRGLPLGELQWPLVGWISSPFGYRDGKPHEGVDFAADFGTPIKTVMPGRVIFAGPRGTYGITVILDHGEGLSTLYAHTSKLLVSEGEWVNKGQTIALVGNTGRSNGPHLHMELQINGIPYDPMMFLSRAKA